jgi:hypothetical protein
VRRGLALIALLGALAGAASAHAESPMLGMYQKYCVAPAAAPAPVLSALAVDGFVRPPAALTKDVGELPFDNAQFRAKLIDDVMIIVIVGTAAGPDSTKFDVCAVAILPSESGAKAAFDGWVGVRPVKAEPGETPTYLFVDGPKGRRSVEDLSSAEGLRAIKAGALRLAGFENTEDTTVMMYGALRPST